MRRLARDVVDGDDDFVLFVVEDRASTAFGSDRSRRDEPACADLANERSVALAKEEDVGGEDVFLVELRLVVNQDGDAIADHLDRARDRLGERFEGFEPKPRALGRDEAVNDGGRAVERDVGGALPSPLVARVVTDQLARPGRDGAIERTIVAEIDRAMNARAVEEELGAASKRANIPRGRTKKTETHRRFFGQRQCPDAEIESKVRTFMAARRLPLSPSFAKKKRVWLTLDDEPVEAVEGEPVAAALVGAGKTTIARSPKFHRPRGPTCMRGACDGCLARVDETPNVMTCLTAAKEGMAIVSQNRFGPRDTDLLRMTDWFFPDGMNHHELFAGVPGIQTIMQGFARRVAGLGRLPVTAEKIRKAVRRSADVVVVGGGPSGVAIAVRLAKMGREVEVLDDQLSMGGVVTALGREEAAAFDPLLAAFGELVKENKIRARSSTTAGAVYGRDLLVSGPDGAEVVESRDLILACGAHDGALAFEGNDVPNVMSARAAGWLLFTSGVVVGDEIVVVIPEGGGPFGESYAKAARALDPKWKIEVVRGDPLAVRGTSRAKGVTVRLASGKDKSFAADAVLIDAARSPAFELAEQAGATLIHEPRGYVVRTENGRVSSDPNRGGIWACGELVGTPLEARAIELAADQLSTQIGR